MERAIGWGNLRAFLTVSPLHNFGKFMVFFSRLQTMMRKACWELLGQNAEKARPFACGGGSINVEKCWSLFLGDMVSSMTIVKCDTSFVLDVDCSAFMQYFAAGL